MADRGLQIDATSAGGAWRAGLAGSLVVAVLGLTTFLKLTLFAGHPLAVDETWTGMIASQPTAADFARQAWGDVNASLAYLVSWVWAGIAGLSNGALRAPSVAFACAAPLIALAAGRQAAWRTRVIWCVLLACWLPGMLFAEQARPYALTLLLAVAVTLAFAGAMDAPRTAGACAWAALASLLILTHYAAAILVAVQGIAYLALRGRRALATWPAALLLLPGGAVLALKFAILSRFASPGVSWIARLTIADLPGMASFFAGGLGLGVYVAVWLAGALTVIWRTPRRSRGAARPPEEGGLRVAALASILAAVAALGLGFILPMVTVRYLTPMVPGVLLALALICGRVWRVSGLFALLLPAAFVAACVAQAVAPPRVRPAFTFEHASDGLMAAGASRLMFFWDNPIVQVARPDALVKVGGFFFARAGRPVPVEAVDWRAGSDPNPAILARAAAPGTGIIWIYDRAVAGTLAIAHPPRIAYPGGSWRCRLSGAATISVLACLRR